MATIKVKWLVEELTNVMTVYDVQKVYWSATEGGAYVEATTPATRVALAAGQSLYYFDHLTGDPSYWYKVSYFNSGTSQESSLSEAFQASAAGGYVTLEEVKAALGANPPDDAVIIETIVMYSQLIDRACRQWFEPRYLDEKVDGTGGRVLWFNVPIIGIDELYMNSDWDAPANPADYEVFNNLGNGTRDDRRDPKIALSDELTTDLYRRLVRKDEFIDGRRNQRVKGTFGFVEPDGSPPALIQRACMKLVVSNLSALDPVNPDPVPAGPLISETTDGHTVRYGSMFSGRRTGTIGITGDAEIEGIIQLYRAPKAMAVVS